MSFKCFKMFLAEYLKEERKEFIYKDYLTSCLNILVQGMQVKKGMDSLHKIYSKLDNKQKEDNRTSEEIEKDVIEKFRRAWG